MMAHKKNEMYNWERFSKPRVYSRNQRLASDNDIQDWIKTVEDASGRAAASTFGTKYVKDGAPRGRAAVKATVADVHLHDAAYAEAQDLLQNWVDTKLDFDSEMDDFSEEKWNKKTQADIKKEWDHLLGDDEEEEAEEEVDYLAKYGLKTSYNSSRAKDSSRDPYSILDKDEGSLVDSILQGLMDKEVIPDHVTKDLDLDDSRRKHVDPRTKMELRRVQVKENKDKRTKEKEKKLKDQQAKKDAQFQARQIVQKEEQGKKIKKQREEFEIQKEMARIKKEMELERRRREDLMQREKHEKELLATRAEEEYERQRIEEHKTEMRSHQAGEVRKREIMKRMEELDKREAMENLKLLQRTFSSWYNIVIQRRMQIGKAKAMSDWKLLLRSFNSWKSFVRSKHVDQQTYQHEYHLKVQQRNKIVSVNHWRQTLLRRCLTAWQLYVTQEHNRKTADHTQKQTKNKMAAFLEAAKRGRLGGGKEQEESSSINVRRSMSLEDLEGGDTTRRKVDDIFSESPKKKGAGPHSARSDASSTQNSARSRSSGRSNKQQPLQAWQVNKKHIKMIGQGGGDGQDTTRSDASTADGASEGGQTAKVKVKPWEKTPFIVNNLENRHKNQQQILENQQKQLKEQHRIIEELQYLQKQQILHQQVATQQLLGKQVNTEGQTAETSAKLQQHLNNLQRQLVEGGDVTGQTATTDRSEVSDPLTPVTPMTPMSAFTDGLETARTDLTNQSERSGVSKATKASSVASSLANPKHAQFLQSMEERAAERARIKKDRDDKRRKEEEERLAQLEAAAEEQRQKEGDEKRRKAEQYREKKRLDKQREIDRQDQAERMRQLAVMAEEHYRLSILKYRGLRPLCKLVSMSRENRERAGQHYIHTTLRKCLLSWHGCVQTELAEKRVMADDMYNYIIVKRAFTRWQHFGEHMNILELRAVKFYETKVKTRVLRELADYAASEKVAGWHGERKAKEHNLMRLKKRTFRAWRSYPEFLREDVKREKRRLEMRKKVASLIPNFSASVDKSSDSIL